MNPVDLLGHQWQPGAMSWAWMKGVDVNGGPIHVLIVESTTGRGAFAFTQEDLEDFIRTAQTQLTGIVLPKPGEVTL